MTTGSLGALRAMPPASAPTTSQGDYPRQSSISDDAIRQDSTFAMAHVQLAYSLMTIGGPGAHQRGQRGADDRFRLRDRLPERERYNVEGAYYMSVAPDRRKAIPAFRRALELDSSNTDAANSLASRWRTLATLPALSRRTARARERTGKWNDPLEPSDRVFRCGKARGVRLGDGRDREIELSFSDGSDALL